MRTMPTMVTVVQIIISDIAKAVYIRFTVFANFPKFQFVSTYWLLRNFYSGDAHHANYGERCSNHHFRYCANCVYKIYNVLKLFEIAACFGTFGFFEISTPVMRTMLTMPNKVYIIIFNIPQTVYIRYTTFWNVSKLLFVLHILAFTKFQLRWCAPCLLWQTMFRSSFPILRTMYIRFAVLSNLSKLLVVLHISAFTKFLIRWCAPCSLCQRKFTSSFSTFQKLCI